MTDLPDDLAYILRRRQDCATAKTIAEELGMTRWAVNYRMDLLRRRDMLPPAGKAREGGMMAWTYHRKKGSAPPIGKLSRVIDDLSTEQVEHLLRCLTREDKTLADLLARMLKEHLDAQQAPK